jgi:alpha-amylase/alpha-mannosidase (GH57 family)
MRRAPDASKSMPLPPNLRIAQAPRIRPIVISGMRRIGFLLHGPAFLMERFICIHAHFYQPPRENPWIETVEQQESAYPYHDWNERINAECYAPNGASRILDDAGRIRQIVNNYGRISFNFGPTLLSWMQENAPETYASILQADKESRQRFSGHGSALAQGYNHMILPLANAHDKHTQVFWGVRDFEHRFGYKPEGMWLPETAVDLETLEALAACGLKFTVLAPRQAARVRRIGGRSWKDVHGGRIDPTCAYLARLPSGKPMNLFFYDGPISQAVAFEHLLNNGQDFASRLESGFSDKRDWPQLMHIATDGETYGHHRKHGDMALAYVLDSIESAPQVRLINYGEFLEKFPPAHEVQIIENTSWSCSHGVERWKSDCGCNSGRAGWRQEWRGPLRAALDYLRDCAAALFEEQASPLLRDPWEARDDYIEVILDRSPEALWVFFEKHSRRELRPEETTRALKLLEMQRHAMLMYTSCGWFFDELSGIETVQVMQYAARVVQLARETSGTELEPEFLKRLAEARSNLPEFGDGATIYATLIRPAMVDLCKVGAHFAISAMFDGDHTVPQFCYDIRALDYRQVESGAARLALARARVTSHITRESRELTFAVIHLGEQVLHAGVRDAAAEGEFVELTAMTITAFSRGNFAEVLRLLDRHFGGMLYSLRSLFKDEQKRILDVILSRTLHEAEDSYHDIYEKHGPLLRFITEMGQKVPEVLRITAEFVLNRDLKHTFEVDPVDFVRVAMLMEMVKREGVQLDQAGVGYAAGNSLTRLLRRLQQNLQDRETLERANVLISLFATMPLSVDYWHAQNIYYSILNTGFPKLAGRHDSGAQALGEAFLSLGEKLRISVPALAPEVELVMAG